VEARVGIDAVKRWGFVEALAEGSVGVDGLSIVRTAFLG
jgi:hypothetical protein